MTTTRTPNWTYGQPRSTVERPVSTIPTVSGSGSYTARHTATADLAARVFPSEREAGRAIGAVKGYQGRKGGWIYATGCTAPIAQGWASIACTHGVAYDPGARGFRLQVKALKALDWWLDRKALRTADRMAAAAELVDRMTSHRDRDIAADRGGFAKPGQW